MSLMNFSKVPGLQLIKSAHVMVICPSVLSLIVAYPAHCPKKCSDVSSSVWQKSHNGECALPIFDLVLKVKEWAMSA